MTAPKRIQRKRTKGWRMPKNTISVTRPGPWGNPFRVGDIWDQAIVWHLPSWNEGATTDGETKLSAQMAADLFRERCSIAMESEAAFVLRGKDLACWCRVGDPCHADVLLEWANS